jgi:glutamate/tyrosine decarboxylase-like PLP-dependent enzyme
MNWKRLSHDEIKNRVFNALSDNVDFRQGKFLGVPASHLDQKVFFNNAPFLKDAPYMSTMVANPNHIGCHTTGESEAFFTGTQQLERELIRICAEDILHGEPHGQDGYVASGGTEANIQAAWIYRNEFMANGLSTAQVALLCSEDTHYAVFKAGNLLGIRVYVVQVDEHKRTISEASLHQTLADMKAAGVQATIVFCNMATTMFGSVDDPDVYVAALKNAGLQYRLHIDGAYGGFIYPFTTPDKKLSFANPEISSVTLDAHKLAQAPYGTGIFLVRKGLMEQVLTREARYVHGNDITLVGSRSGANAVATWMILSTYGPYEWREKILLLMNRTDLLCKGLDAAGISYYRNPCMNIVTMHANQIPAALAEEFHLVPDDHHNPKWYKVVVMDHVIPDLLVEFTARLPKG